MTVLMIATAEIKEKMGGKSTETILFERDLSEKGIYIRFDGL
jgi:hypothetical protein